MAYFSHSGNIPCDNDLLKMYVKTYNTQCNLTNQHAWRDRKSLLAKHVIVTIQSVYKVWNRHCSLRSL